MLRRNFYTKLMTSEYGPVAQHYIKSLEAEESSLNQEFFKHTAITPEKFQALLVSCYKQYSLKEQEHLSGKDNFYPDMHASSIRIIEQADRTCIDAVLDQAGICASFIQFVYCTYVKNHCGFSAGVNTVFIDPLKIRNQQWYKRVLTHELVHALHNDYVTQSIVSHFCNTNNEYFENKYSRFTEKRADILGCLLSPEYAHVGACFFNTLLPHEGGPQHPTHGERAKYLWKLYTQTDQNYIRKEHELERARHDTLYRFLAV